MSSILAAVSRGDIVESVHYGHIVVADSTGEVLAYTGNPDTVTYMRSSAKPIQALNVIISGAAEKFKLNQKELAILCSSHYGEDMHRDVIHGLLKKFSLPKEALLCGTPLSIKPDYQKQQLLERHVLEPGNSDCSGKHCGFLAVCLTSGHPLENYNAPDHPMQKEILSILSDFTETSPDAVPIGVDGCGVPVHAFKVKSMAQTYARFANPDSLTGKYVKYREGCRLLFDAVNKEPEMLAGTGGFCTEFLRHTNGRFIGKLGAEAVYCIGVKDRNIGIAVKISDGNYRALYPVVMSVLDQMELLSRKEKEALKEFANPPVINDLGNPVGEIMPVFKLKKQADKGG